MPIAVVETTIPDGPKGQALIDDVLSRRLAACANVVGVDSTYWWKGEMVGERERLVLFKTSVARAEELVAALSEGHPYEVAYIAWRVEQDVAPDYVAWVESETSSSGGSKTRPSSSRA
jgi:periplasmic divalent cation tolerance protein